MLRLESKKSAGNFFLRSGNTTHMSRIGKKLIEIPEKTEVTQNGTKVTVKGPKGTLERDFGTSVIININGKEITLSLKKETNTIQPMWGTTGAHLLNMIKGVNEMFTK